MTIVRLDELVVTDDPPDDIVPRWAGTERQSIWSSRAVTIVRSIAVFAMVAIAILVLLPAAIGAQAAAR